MWSCVATVQLFMWLKISPNNQQTLVLLSCTWLPLFLYYAVHVTLCDIENVCNTRYGSHYIRKNVVYKFPWLVLNMLFIAWNKGTTLILDKWFRHQTHSPRAPLFCQWHIRKCNFHSCTLPVPLCQLGMKNIGGERVGWVQNKWNFLLADKTHMFVITTNTPTNKTHTDILVLVP
jgi:hypothetical protein